MRASTASRTVAGTISVPAAMDSVTKNGLPPVRAQRSSASSAESSARPDGRPGEPAQLKPGGVAAAGQLSEDNLERVVAMQAVVAEAQRDEHGD